MRHRPAGGAACSDEAIRACLAVKVLFGLPLRQTTVRQASPSRACCGWRRWTGRYRITVRCVGDSGPRRSDCPTGDRRGRCICWWTAPGSRSAARGLGMPASMVALAGAFVGRSTWGSTKRRWRSGRSRVRWRLVDVYVDGPEEPVDSSQFGDAPVVPDLIGQIPMAESIGSVTADGAYDRHRCETRCVADSLRESMPLHGLDEQATCRPPSHDELVRLQHVTAEAWVSAGLGRRGNDVVGAA